MDENTRNKLARYRKTWESSKSRYDFWTWLQIKRTWFAYFDVMKQGTSSDPIDMILFQNLFKPISMRNPIYA